MSIASNVSLRAMNTFGIAAKAKYFANITSVPQLREILKKQKGQALFILGGGSNMLLTKDIDALVLHINLKGKEIIAEDETSVTLTVMAGENWHELVLWTIGKGYGGLENLSLIPGNTGTAPIQNIGAYGVELKDSFVNCEALDRETGTSHSFSAEACRFGYRDSIFKREAKNKYIITSVTLKLYKAPYHSINTQYGALRKVLEDKGLENPTIKEVSNAVIAVRNSKLPNPKILGNSGSFSKTPS